MNLIPPDEGRRRGCRRPGTPPCAGLLLALAVTSVAVATTPTSAAPSTAGPRTLVLEAVTVNPDTPAVAALVDRHLALRPGEPVDSAVLTAVRSDLEATGYFREVVLYTSRGREPGLIVLHVQVRLDRKLRFLTGFGHDPLDGWYLNLVGARLLNRPRPGGEWRLAYRSGDDVQGLYLEGRMQAGDRAADAWLLELSVLDKQWFAYDGREEWWQSIGSASARVGREEAVGASTRVTGWIGVRTVDPSEEFEAFRGSEDLSRPAAAFLPVATDRHGYLDAWIDVRRDRRDPARPWRGGSWLGGRLQLSQEFDGHHHHLIEVDGRHTVPVGAGAALAGRLRAAHASTETPYFDRFRFGGVPSVRGYDVAFLSGPLGAVDLVQINLEYRAALLDRGAPTPRVTGLLFLDSGQAWDEHGGSAGWVAGAGFGVRVRLPWVHLLGVDVGYPLVDVGDMSPFGVNLALGWSY
jgi:hypothetical protein